MDLVTGNLLNGQLVELRIAPAVLAGANAPDGKDLTFVKGNILGFDQVGIIVQGGGAATAIANGAQFFPWTSVLGLTVVA